MGATCSICGQDMKEATGCTYDKIMHKGLIYNRSTYHFDEPDGKCNDCGAHHGKFHHPGCDVERCPICGGQLISCSCFPSDIDFVQSVKK